MGNSLTKASLKTSNANVKVKEDRRVIRKSKSKGRSKGIFKKRRPSLPQPPAARSPPAPLQLHSFEPIEDGIDSTSNPNQEIINRLRTQIRTDLQTFVLNNLLMSAQFFENYEREVGSLRVSPMSESEVDRNTSLLHYQKHCLSPDKLHEVASRHVRFRSQHGSRKHYTELLNPPRLVVVQDNVEVYEGTDSVDYSSVLGAPVYRLTMESADKKGYVMLRSDEKRRPTYEMIDDKKSDYEGTYSRIPGDSLTPSPRRSDKTIKEEDKKEEKMEEDTQLTEGQKMMLDLQEHIACNGKRDPTSAINMQDTIPQIHIDIQGQPEMVKKQFGPQQNEYITKPSQNSPTQTERRLSGIIKGVSHAPKFIAPIPLTKLQRQNKLTKSMPNLADSNPTTSESSLTSESSGYKSGTSSARTNLSLPNSRGSDVEYGYTTIVGFSTPKPLETQRLGNVPVNSMAIPNECFRSVDVKTAHSQVGKLFETRQFLDSRAYVGNFADIFAEGLSNYLGITSESLDTATIQGHQIFCETLEEGSNLIPHRTKKVIIPSITATCWPQDAQEWSKRRRKQLVDEVNHVAFSWPTHHMITQIKRFGCHALPVGFMPCRGENKTRDLEWRLAFPEAERYLESCLTHAQVRCYLFTLALYKNFLEPMNAELGLTTENIRTLLFWQCERNYLAWPEDRPGETLQKFLKCIYEALMRENLPDYFVSGRNQFESTPTSHLRRVQEKLFRIKENLTMHTLMMVRNLRYVHEGSFFPRLDYRRLYEIITTENVLTLVNPAIARSMPAQQEREEEEGGEDSEDESAMDMWTKVRKEDPGRQWNKKVNRQIEAEKVAQKLTQEFTRPSIDSVDLTILPGRTPEAMRRQLLLEFFIPHFIEMARKSNEFRAPKQGIMYMDHAECLANLLGEETDRADTSRKLILQIKSLRESSTVGHNELRSPVKLQPTPILNPFPKLDSPIKKGPPIQELPPVPSTSGYSPPPKPQPQPAVKPAGLKRLSFVLPDEEPGQNMNSKVLKNPSIPVIGNNKMFFNFEQSITLEETINEESTDF